jgi:hypothetical protein
VDVPAEPDAHRRTDEHDRDQAVGRDLLGPGEGIVEDIAREELEEDRETHQPEDREARPVLKAVRT